MSSIENIQQNFKNYVIGSYNRLPIAFVTGQGSFLYDTKGKEYIDLLSGIGVTILGHSNKNIINAMDKESHRLVHTSNLFFIENQGEAAQFLCSVYPSKTFFCNSGAEANEAAIKLARIYGKSLPGKPFRIITMKNSFHGRTLATLSATGQKKIHKGFEPLLNGFDYALFNNISSVESKISAKTIAIMIEVIQGEGGIIPAEQSFLKNVVELCKKNKLLLIVDEVQTGMGRTGKFFAFQHYGIKPDIITLAKGLGGGLPVGAMLCRKSLAKYLSPGTHASTFGGSHFITGVVKEVLKQVLDSNFLKRVNDTAKFGWQKIKKYPSMFSVVKDVRGKGLMFGIVLKKPAPDAVLSALEKGVVINHTNSTIRLLPSLNIDKKTLQLGLERLELVLEELSNKVK